MGVEVQAPQSSDLGLDTSVTVNTGIEGCLWAIRRGGKRSGIRQLGPAAGDMACGRVQIVSRHVREGDSKWGLEKLKVGIKGPYKDGGV